MYLVYLYPPSGVLRSLKPFSGWLWLTVYLIVFDGIGWIQMTLNNGLNGSGLFCMSFYKFEKYQMVLGGIGWNWMVLNGVGCYWMVLDGIRWYWIGLHGTGG